jgi:hypothetical protein
MRTTILAYVIALGGVAMIAFGPEAVVLNLVQPSVAGRQLIGFGWEARRDETRPVRYAATCRNK